MCYFIDELLKINLTVEVVLKISDTFVYFIVLRNTGVQSTGYSLNILQKNYFDHKFTP